MTLADAGKLGLDDPVEKCLPEFRDQKDTNGTHHVFTIRHLMSHTSGLVSNPPTRRSAWPIGGPLDDFWLEQELSGIIQTIARSQLRFKPGSKFEYSNSAFFILGRVIEVISGKSYSAYMKEKILDPLGMNDTNYAPPAADARRIAVIYGKREGKRETIFRFNPAVRISNAAPDGGLFSYPRAFQVRSELPWIARRICTSPIPEIMPSARDRLLSSVKRLSSTPAVVGQTYSLKIPMSSGHTFYRLRGR